MSDMAARADHRWGERSDRPRGTPRLLAFGSAHVVLDNGVDQFDLMPPNGRDALKPTNRRREEIALSVFFEKRYSPARQPKAALSESDRISAFR